MTDSLFDKLFIDSNVWVYLFTNEDSVKCKIAEQFIQQNCLKNVLVVSYQVINEITNVLKRKKYTESEIRFIIESILEICIVQDCSKETLLLASKLRENHHFSLWDSLIVACASISGCCFLISEDMQNNMTINGLTIKNIFG